VHYRAGNGADNSKEISKGDLIEKEGDVQGYSFIKSCFNYEVVFPF
jgi:hypothetical protein